MLPWRTSARQGQVSATGFEQLHGALSPGKQHELRERQSALVMSSRTMPDAGYFGGLSLRKYVQLVSFGSLHSPGARANRGWCSAM